MPVLAAITGSAGGGRIILPKPILQHAPGVGFTISNYDPTAIYTVSAGSRNGNTINLSMSVPATVTARAPKGIVATDPVAIERRTITFTSPVYVQTGFSIFGGPCSPGDTCYGTCGEGTNNCGRSQGYTVYNGEDSPPSGFVKLNSEWVKIL